MDPGAAAAALQQWFAAHQRALPWRRSPTPYKVLVTEFLLQQTRVETGLRYWAPFLRRFPALRSLAHARESEVLAAWSGLGYYARARRLHATARELVRNHGGRIPCDPKVLEALPGIGPYTAGAIASIAYDRPVPALDGNQDRVIGRVLGLKGPAGARRQGAAAWAEKVLQHASPRSLNQALMDLGSQVCLPRSPRCSACPLAAACLGRRGSEAPRVPRRRRPTEHWTASIHWRDGKVWLARPRPSGLLARLWLPPLRRQARPTATPAFVHHFSHRRWSVGVRSSAAQPQGAGQWVTAQAISQIPHSSLTLKILRHAGFLSPHDQRKK